MIKLFLFYILVLIPSFSWAVLPTAKVRIKLISGEGFASLKDVSAEPLWEKNDEDAFEFFWRVRLDVTSGKTITAVEGATTFYHTKKEDGSNVFVKMGGTSDRVTVTFSDSSRATIQLNLSLPVKDRIVGQCDDLGLLIDPVFTEQRESPQAAAASIPGYVYFRCDVEKNGTILSVSVPEEVQWRSTSLYELHGKGRRFKSFTVNTKVAPNQDTEVAKFRLLRAGKEYAYVVRVPKAAELIRLSNFVFGLGLIEMTLKAGDKTSDPVVKPAAIISLEFRPLWPRLVFGGHGVSSLPTIGQGKFFTHTESVGFLGYTFGGEDTHRWEPRIYLYFADGVSQDIDYFYSLATPAAGGLFASPKNSRWRYSLEGYFGILGGQSVTCGRASLGRQLGFGEIGVRGVVNLIGVNTETAKKAAGSQVAGGLYLEF